jgi:hypothetical protein
LAVSDSGIGIAAENLERIFESFTQSHQPAINPSSGLGIGLSVVRRIVELHGAHVKVASADSSAGSEFVVSLPLAAADTQHDLVGSTKAGKDLGAVRGMRARRLMIVDDHQQIRASVTRLARSWG